MSFRHRTEPSPPSVRARGLAIVATAWLAFGCTNGLLSRSTTALSTSGAYTSSNDSTNTNAFTITTVVKDTNNPATVLDLVGDGSGAMGNNCPQAAPSTSSSSSSTGGLTSSTGAATSPCTCVLQYTVTNPQSGASTVQSYEAYTIYTESDLIECDYSGVPAGVTAARVWVKLVSSGETSNQVTVSLQGNYGSVDVTNIANFASAQRWQCRNIVTLPTVTNTIYDPIQSEDPHIYYPLDFYATNFGWTLAQYAQTAQLNTASCPTQLNSQSCDAWSCPSNPNATALRADPHYNLRVYSVQDLNGVKDIYPPQPGQFDRSTFYLSKAPSGAFTMPVNAFIAPTVVTSDTSPLGYGAQPVTTGSGTETCPTASMPPGYQWVKVWLFRADLQPRTYLEFQNSTLSPPDGFENVMCNPANLYPCDTSANPGCSSAPGAFQCGAGAPTLGAGATGSLAARVLGNTSCMSVAPGALNSSVNTNSCEIEDQGISNGLLGCGTDDWTPFPANGNAVNCPDPLGVCAAGGGTGPATPKAPAQVVNYDGNAERYDYLFVVTPPTVNSVDMLTGALGKSYTPYRFISSGDCNSDDPDASGCPAQYIISYSLKLHDVSTNGDPPAGPARPPEFPVCAIQPN